MVWRGQLYAVSEHIVHSAGSGALVVLWSILSVRDSHATLPSPFHLYFLRRHRAEVLVKDISLDRLNLFWSLGCSREAISAEDSGYVWEKVN